MINQKQTTPDELDLLISRIVDGEASDAEWTSFRDVASRTPKAWEQLAQWQHDHRMMCEAVGGAIAVAEARDVPAAGSALVSRVRSAMSWGGWAAAAAVALTVWMNQTGAPSRPTDDDGYTAGLDFPVTPRTPDEALDRYLEIGKNDGRVIRQLPDRVLVQSEPLQSGGYEVVFIRQIMEREVVKQFYEVQGTVVDENGNRLRIRMAPVSAPAGLN